MLKLLQLQGYDKMATAIRGRVITKDLGEVRTIHYNASRVVIHFRLKGNIQIHCVVAIHLELNLNVLMRKQTEGRNFRRLIF